MDEIASMHELDRLSEVEEDLTAVNFLGLAVEACMT